MGTVYCFECGSQEDVLDLWDDYEGEIYFQCVSCYDFELEHREYSRALMVNSMIERYGAEAMLRIMS